MHACAHRRGGRIVWTNARAQQEALQAISLKGPVTAVINSSTAAPGLQSFSLQPNVDAPPDLTTSFANVTLALEPSELSYMAQASLRNTFYPNRTCFRDSVSSSVGQSLTPCMHACICNCTHCCTQFKPFLQHAVIIGTVC